MRLRLWIGLAAVLAIAAGSLVAALLVHAGESARFHEVQRQEAVRSARQAGALARLSVAELATSAAFFQAEGGGFSKHEFRVVAAPLLGRGVLHGTAFVKRARGGRLLVAFSLGGQGVSAPVGRDLSDDPAQAPYLRRARDRAIAVATAPARLPADGLGIDVYRPVYRDGAPTATVAERRAALLGFAAGTFRLGDLAAAASAGLPAAVDVQLRVGRGTVIGDPGRLEDPAQATVHVADRTWLLVVRDPNRPDVGLPALIGGVGISLAALLAALVLVWSRNERLHELQREAGEDPLTGLENRRSFDQGLRREMARGHRHGGGGAMLMIDLDHFKRVNDSRGHPAGDRLIQEIAKLLRGRVRETDLLARIGGDEFAILLPDTGAEEARLVAEAIVAAIREGSRGEGEGVTASVGVAIFGGDVRLSPEALASRADAAMYAAKEGGRDGVRVFDRVVVREGTAPRP
jgi:diguanylate cyclase (GGDEF)-like protein